MIGAIILILILILINGIFAMSEIAIASARKSKLKSEAKKGNKKAEITLALLSEPNRLLSTTQIVVTLIGITLGIIGGTYIAAPMSAFLQKIGIAQRFSDAFSSGLIIIFTAYLSLVIGDLTPKRIALSNPEGAAKRLAPYMDFFSHLASPLISLLSRSTEGILRVLKIGQIKETISQEEIQMMIAEAASAGMFEDAEKKIFERAFRLADKKIGSLMTHRKKIDWLDINDPWPVNREKIIKNAYKGFIVCDGELDTILGSVYIKDILQNGLYREDLDLRNLLKKVLLIPENMSAYKLLEKFKEEETHFAVIVDEYGDVLGFVTLNDLSNALLGDIPTTDGPKSLIMLSEDGSYEVDGSIPFDTFLSHFGIEDISKKEKEGFYTLGGFILNKLNNIPKKTEKFSWNNLVFEIIDMRGNRIAKVLIKKVK